MAADANNKRLIAVRTLRQYWERLLSRLKQPSAAHSRQTTGSDVLEHELSAISSQNRALAEQVQQYRTDLERVRDEENRQIVELDQVRHSLEIARDEDSRKLAELESSNSRLATAREADSAKILDLGKRLAEIETERDQARDQVQALEDALTDTTSRLQKTDIQIRNLQVQSVEQLRQLEDSLSDAGNRLESMDNQVRILGIKLENERQHVLKNFQVMQSRVHKQNYRLNWTITAAVFALLLGAVAGGVQLWHGQKNAVMLSDMSRDIKTVMTAVNRGLSGTTTMDDLPLEEELQPHAADSGALMDATPAYAAAETAQPAATEDTASSESEPGRVLSGNPPGRARTIFSAGERQYTRQDARKFFEDNAANADVTTLPNGVQYRVVRFGSGKSPTLADQVVVSYVGIRPDGEVTTETYSDGAPMTFSMKQVMPGWQEVLLEMREGAEFELYVPSNVASTGGVRKRGLRGFEPSIYLIELLQVVDNAATDPAGPAN
ncbi:MAG TPA: FKBP-type peptidyl-prolyl cis-trans isomerase [Gammaproteobacteria bacterium]|nr:FKBP-type peptidyl-prolyl cis-trans isomerase [Gammaproteobacteria bacterium]